MSRDALTDPQPGDVWSYLYRLRLILVTARSGPSVSTRWWGWGDVSEGREGVDDLADSMGSDYTLCATGMDREAFKALTPDEAAALSGLEVTP